MGDERDYLPALTTTLHLEEDPAEPMELAAIRREFPGVCVTARIIQSSSGSGVTRYAAMWLGHAVTAYSFASLRGQLHDIDLLPRDI